MKGNQHITRVFAFFMSIFMLMTLLHKQPAGNDEVVDKADKTEQNDSTPDEEQTYISELSSEVVIPSHAFNFDGVLGIVPSPEVKVLSFSELIISIAQPVFKHSYFEKLFEHHIAINAP